MADFEEGLCDCFANCPVCLVVTFVPCGICCVQAKAYDNATQQGMGFPFLCYCVAGLVNCCCIGMAVMRGKIRNRFNINGSIVHDICCHIWCSPCAVCQEYREVKRRLEKQESLTRHNPNM